MNYKDDILSKYKIFFCFILLKAIAYEYKWVGETMALGCN
jgi:hypothetical protein